jgi:hypothetical protein
LVKMGGQQVWLVGGWGTIAARRRVIMGPRLQDTVDLSAWERPR